MNLSYEKGTCNENDAIHFAELSNMAAQGDFETYFGCNWRNIQKSLYKSKDTISSHERVYFICSIKTNDILGHINCINYDEYLKV